MKKRLRTCDMFSLKKIRLFSIVDMKTFND